MKGGRREERKSGRLIVDKPYKYGRDLELNSAHDRLQAVCKQILLRLFQSYLQSFWRRNSSGMSDTASLVAFSTFPVQIYVVIRRDHNNKALDRKRALE